MAYFLKWIYLIDSYDFVFEIIGLCMNSREKVVTLSADF